MVLDSVTSECPALHLNVLNAQKQIATAVGQCSWPPDGVLSDWTAQLTPRRRTEQPDSAAGPHTAALTQESELTHRTVQLAPEAAH